MKYCYCCAVKLESVFDADPNGSLGAVCARCRAEAEHDYDVEPDAEFNRAGRRVDEKELKRKLKFLEEEEPFRCIVKGCENRTDQGHFVGDLCSPCREYITSGRGIYSQAYRNTQAEVLKEREECARVCDDLSDRDYGPYGQDAEERDIDASMQCAQMIRLRNKQ